MYAVAAGGGHCGDTSTSPISELQPHLERLEANPGSIVLLAIEKPQVWNFARCIGVLLRAGKSARRSRSSLRMLVRSGRKAEAEMFMA